MLQKTLTVVSATTTGQFSVVMRFTIIGCQFFPFFDIAERIEFHAVLHHAQISIGIAGVVDVFEVVGVGRSIQCQVIIQFHEVDDFDIADQFACFTHGNDHAAEVTDLTAGRYTTGSKSTFPGNAAFGNFNGKDDAV